MKLSCHHDHIDICRRCLCVTASAEELADRDAKLVAA